MLGSPAFSRLAFRLENGRTFRIDAPGNSARDIYIQSATLKGKPFTRSSLTHAQLLNGGTLRLTMGAHPNPA